MAREKGRKTQSRGASQHRVLRMREASLKPPVHHDQERLGKKNFSLDCGWGRLLFAQTFETNEGIIEQLRSEGPGRRDIAFYVRDPHVLLATAPQELFLDPSHTYRLDLSTYRTAGDTPRGFFIRRLSSAQDAEEVNRIYGARNMVTVPPDFFWTNRDNRAITYFVVEEEKTGVIIGPLQCL